MAVMGPNAWQQQVNRRLEAEVGCSTSSGSILECLGSLLCSMADTSADVCSFTPVFGLTRGLQKSRILSQFWW